MAARIPAVDLDFAAEAHVIVPRSNDLPQLHQKHPRGLVLEPEFTGELEGSESPTRVGLVPIAVIRKASGGSTARNIQRH
jgi:hypothetical protein